MKSIKTKTFKYFLMNWFPVILWAAIIFTFSSMPYEKQDMRPMLDQYINEQQAEQLLHRIQFNYADKEVSIHQDGVSGFIEFFIRKGGHLFEYAILALLLYRALLSRNSKLSSSFLIALLLSILYASSDEWHQSFVIHRTAKVEDVLLDSVGALLGVLAFLLYKRFWNKKHIAKNS